MLELPNGLGCMRPVNEPGQHDQHDDVRKGEHKNCWGLADDRDLNALLTNALQAEDTEYQASTEGSARLHP